MRVFRQAQDALVQFRFNEEVVAIDDTDQVEKKDSLKQVETNRGSYLCRKVILAFGLLHFPPELAALDRLGPKKVHYKTPKTWNYKGSRVLVVGGGDSALDATMMVLARNGMVEMVVREEVPVGKSDTRGRVDGGNTSRDLRVQGNHQPILVERESSARRQGRLGRRKDHPSRPAQPPAHKVGDRPREMPHDP